MSIFRLKNKTGTDSFQEWASFTFPNNIAIDLIDSGSYGSPSVQYSLGLMISDIIGCQGGGCFERIRTLIKSGNWKLNDGERDYYYEEAMYLLKFGTLCGFELIGEAKTIVTSDLCVPTTWYYKSVQVTDGVLSHKDGAFFSGNKNWIYLTEGFLYQEDPIATSKLITIKVNGTPVTSNNYVIDYQTGMLRFVPGYTINQETDIVTASYWYATSTIWEMQTDAGYMWRINRTEMQVDQGIVFNAPLIMEIIIDHPVYGQDFVVTRWVYKSMRDFVSGSNLGYYIPAFGGTKIDSGVSGGIVILPFNYDRPKDLPVGLNARVRVRIQDDLAPTGKYGTVTFFIEKIKL